MARFPKIAIPLVPVLSGLLWALAFFLSLGTVAPLEIERLAAVTVCLVSLAPLVFGGAPLPGREVAAPRIALAVLLLWVLAAVSCAWSAAPPVSLIYLGVFSALPATLLALLIAGPAMRRSFLRWALGGSGLVIVGLAVWALVQVLCFPEMLNNGKVRNPFANPNAFAGLLGLAFFTGLGFYLKERDRRIRGVLFIALYLILAAFVSLASRAASGTMALGLIVLVIGCGRAVLLPRWKPLLCLALAVILTGILIAHLPARGNLLHQISTVANGDAPSINSRLYLWQSALDLIAQHPLLGHGYRTFYLLYPSVRNPAEIYSSGFMAHSDPLQLWAEIGVLGPGLFYTIGVLTLLRFIRFRRGRRREDAAQSAFVLSLLLGCGGFVVHAHVDFLFYAMPMLMLFALTFTRLLIETGPGQTGRRLAFMQHWPKDVPAAALTLPVIGFLALFVPLMLGEYQTNLADRALRDGDLDAFGAHVNAANHIGWGLNDRPYLMASSVPMGILQGHQGPLPRVEQDKLFRQTDRLLTRALRRNARMAAAWHQRGLMVKALDAGVVPADYPDAETCFKTALALNPLYLASRLELATLYEDRGDTSKTLEVLAAGLSWPYPDAAAFAYYDRTERLAMEKRRTDIAASVRRFRTLQQERLNVALAQREALQKAGLSTGN